MLRGRYTAVWLVCSVGAFTHTLAEIHIVLGAVQPGS